MNPFRETALASHRLSRRHAAKLAVRSLDLLHVALAHPARARFGQGWRQPDIGWQVVRLLQALGLARVRPDGGG